MGPEFLQRSEEYWPKHIWDLEGAVSEEEIKGSFIHSTVPTVGMLDVSRFSNWLRLVRSQAFVLRFVHNSQTKEKSKKNAGPFTSTEIRCAEEYLFKVAQINCYPGEVMSLLKSKDANLIGTVERTSKVYNRSPYLDDSNVLRVKGRIDAAQTVSDDVKRPIILPANHAITRLLVDFFHRRYHHLCHETVINELQQRYSIPKVRVALRTVRSNCQSCKNQGVKPIAPEMSDLPLLDCLRSHARSPMLALITLAR